MNSLRVFLFGFLLLAACGGSDGGSGGGGGGSVPPAFAVLSSLPADSAAGVSRCAALSVTFNKDADASTLTSSTFLVSDGGSVSGTRAYDASTRTATFTPTGLLTVSTLYTVSLTSGIKTTAGETLTPTTFSFTSDAAFQRTFSNPLPGATNVPLNTVITVTFNKDLDAGALQTAAFSVTGKTVTSVPYDASTRTVTINVAGDLPITTTVAVTLAGPILTADGCAEALTAGNFDFSFTTGSTGDTTAPSFGGASSASATNAFTIVVSWSAATDNVTPSSSIVYRIYRATSTGTQDFASPTATTSAGATSHTDTGLTSNLWYYYVVRARDTSGNTDQNVIEVTAKTRISWSGDVWPVIQANCQSCHTSGSGTSAFLMTNATITRNSWVGILATCSGASPATRVVPGSSAASFVYQKISTLTPSCGLSMPRGLPLLPVADQNKIRDWIDQGALNN